MKRLTIVLTRGAALFAASLAIVQSAHFSSWSPAMNLEAVSGAPGDTNTSASDGCPTPSRDGLRLYIASTRAGGLGGQDIWVAERESTEEPFGSFVNLGKQINSASNEFCPSPMRDGHGFMFVSNRLPDPDRCPTGGGDDIYATRFHPNKGWVLPENLCAVNSPANEASPFLVEEDSGARWLYFSSNRSGGSYLDAPGAVTGDIDIYVSFVSPDGSLGLPVAVDELNTPQDDARPNVRRDHLELFFDSNRPDPTALGLNDIWTATRLSTSEPWSSPVNLGPNVNSAAAETRASLSWGATILYFGSTRPGSEPGPTGVPSQDVYFTTRHKLTGRR
jgi:hypothetical protein